MTYKVLVNHAQQYAIWPADKEIAPGWNEAGASGTKQECLAYVQRVWVDQRPMGLRYNDGSGLSKA
jgi:MbtH protein